MISKVEYGGWHNCLRLTDGKIEAIVTTDCGPRIIRFGFVGGQNVLKEFQGQLGRTMGEEWLPYGGHRLWHAPESNPRTYQSDNEPIDYTEDTDTVRLLPAVERETGIRKELHVRLLEDGRLHLVHILRNEGAWDIELAPWAITVMAPGGRAIFPQEDFKPHPEYLLPARPLVLWPYTNMSDPRFSWGERFIQMRQHPGAHAKLKIGMRNSKGWMAYALGAEVFVKRAPFNPAAQYPDYGCNTETFTDSAMLELETLGPLTRIAPGASIQHEEVWSLHKKKIGESEREIGEQLPPLVPQLP